MTKVKLTEEARRRERNARRDDAFRVWIGTIKAMSGKTNEGIGRVMRICEKTVRKRIFLPETMTIGELRLINDSLPEGMKIPSEVIGL